MIWRISVIVSALLAQSAAFAGVTGRLARPAFDKVLVVVLENADYDKALREPGFAALAARGALLTDFHAEAHPSQPNYIALISGDTRGVTDDGAASVRGKTLVDLLEARHKSWKAYLEGYPGSCFAADQGEYVRKHNPLISFPSISGRPSRCSRLVPATELSADLRAGTLPDFSLYIPDVRNDGHDTGVAFASRWLSDRFFPGLGPLPKGLLVIVTFDESGSGSRAQGNHILTALAGSGVRPGSRSGARYDHYSILRTIEDRFGLGTLGEHDAQASPITDIWS